MFTKFGVGALEPTESAMRRQTIYSRAVYDMNDLDAYVKTSLKLTGTALENLNETLDGIIDNKIRSTVSPATPATPTPKTPVVPVKPLAPVK
jgi:hypothetical protein